MTSRAIDNHTRPLTGVVPAATTMEGAGFEVLRPFPTVELDWLDPFLLLDEMAPTDFEPGESLGFPPHPHRGFETVSHMLQGEVEHSDSAGNHGAIGPGDVQWMTAGDGIVHSEMPHGLNQDKGGTIQGFQLWVNLPAALRRTQPRYQAIRKSQLARATGAGWTAEVVAGSMLGVEGPADTHTPIGYARVTIEAGATLRIPVPDGHTAAVYAFDGAGTAGIDDQPLEAHHLAVFERSRGDIVITAASDPDARLDAIVLTGEPINEPIARRGPFVMNTAEEIEEAITDFQAGRMGTLQATGSA